MKKIARGFTLIELIAVTILVGILSVALFSRIESAGSAAIQSSRDGVIAALFFAQQQAMMRNNITVVVTANSISVNESGTPLLVSNGYYPLAMPNGISLAPAMTLTYDRLGRIGAATTISLTGTGSNSGVSASIRVEASGYAYAN